MDGLTPICPYCKAFSKQVSGKEIYPHRPDLFHKQFFLCVPCDAYVGTHNRTGQPLGTLANAHTRRLRSLAHAAFDPIWREEGYARTVAYSMLAQGLNISPDDCHIAMFDNALCKRAADLCNSREIYRYDPKARPPHQASDQDRLADSDVRSDAPKG